MYEYVAYIDLAGVALLNWQMGIYGG